MLLRIHGTGIVAFIPVPEVRVPIKYVYIENHRLIRPDQEEERTDRAWIRKTKKHEKRV